MKREFIRLPKPIDFFWLIFLLIVFSQLASCSTTRKVNKQTVTVDSTVIQENRMLKEAVQEMSHTIEKLTTDSSSQVVVFESDPYHIDSATLERFYVKGNRYDTTWEVKGRWEKPKTTIKFRPDKSIESIETDQNIKSITAKANRTESERDSLAEVNSVLIDSLAYYKAQKAVNIETMDKKVSKSWWWLWLILVAVGGFALRHNLPWIKRRVFG